MKLYSNEYVEKYIIENKDKKILREMARDLGYSDRWVKKLMNKLNKE